MRLRPFLVSACLALVACALSAQPSGGPYGPQPQTYEIPANAAHVYYVAQDGNPAAAGTTLDAPSTLESVLPRVVTGDAVILRGGTYRTGGLVLNQGITLQPYRDEQPVFKGTQIATEWKPLREGIWRTTWKTLFPSEPRDWWRREREGMRTPLHRFNNDMVFVDGKPLRSVGWEGELDAGSCYIDYKTGHVFIRTDPTNRLVEITAWDSFLVRTSKPVHGKTSDRKGYAMRGLTITQYAYRPLEVEGKRGSVTADDEPTDDPEGVADPSTFGKEVTGTLIEHCTITHSSRVAGYFRGDGLVIRNCLVSDTSTEGIYIIGSSDCTLERNIIARNNIEQLTGYYPSAVKIFNQTHRVVCRDNLVIDNPHSNGIWYDVGNVDGLLINNWIEGCQDGFFFEISKGCTVTGNVFVNCTNGVRILNSSGATIQGNTFLNAPVLIERTERSATGDHFGWHPATGPDVNERHGHTFSGNLLMAEESFAAPLLRVEQSAKLLGQLTTPQLATLTGNLYVRPASDKPLLTWSRLADEAKPDEFKSPAALLAKYPGMEERSASLSVAPNAIVRSVELKQLQPSRPLPLAVGAHR